MRWMACWKLTLARHALEAELLVPPEVLEENLPALRNIAIRQLGRLHGHAWEQIELPRLAQGLLLNFCNTFPMAITPADRRHS